MDYNDNIFNAVVIAENCENPSVDFIVDGNHLHAVEDHVAKLRKAQSNPELVLPMMREALKALVQFSEGKVPTPFTELVSIKGSEKDQIFEKITAIYFHLPHHFRNELSSLIHHRQTAKSVTR